MLKNRMKLLLSATECFIIGYMATQYRKNRAVASMVFGILGFLVNLLGLPMSIAAWRLGHTTLIGMQQGHVNNKDMGIAKAGKILGMIGVGLWCAAIVLIMVLVALFGA